MLGGGKFIAYRPALTEERAFQSKLAAFTGRASSWEWRRWEGGRRPAGRQGGSQSSRDWEEVQEAHGAKHQFAQKITKIGKPLTRLMRKREEKIIDSLQKLGSCRWKFSHKENSPFWTKRLCPSVGNNSLFKKWCGATDTRVGEAGPHPAAFKAVYKPHQNPSSVMSET